MRSYDDLFAIASDRKGGPEALLEAPKPIAELLATPEDRFDALVSDTRILRHGAKIQAVQANAVFIQDLRAEGVIDKPATSKSAMSRAQGAFNIWMEQSGRGLTQISRTLAMTL